MTERRRPAPSSCEIVCTSDLRIGLISRVGAEYGSLHLFRWSGGVYSKNDREVYAGYLPGVIERHSENALASCGNRLLR